MTLPKERNNYPIGTVYKTRGKSPRVCTIIDRLRTYSERGDLVKVRYVATHEFMGQTITERDVLPTTVAMGLVSAPA